MLTVERLERDQARLRRYRILRNWALAVGVIAIPVAWLIASTSDVVGDDLRQFLIGTLVSGSFAFFTIAALLHGVSKRSHGEV